MLKVYSDIPSRGCKPGVTGILDLHQTIKGGTSPATQAYQIQTFYLSRLFGTPVPASVTASQAPSPWMPNSLSLSDPCPLAALLWSKPKPLAVKRTVSHQVFSLRKTG